MNIVIHSLFEQIQILQTIEKNTEVKVSFNLYACNFNPPQKMLDSIENLKNKIFPYASDRVEPQEVHFLMDNKKFRGLIKNIHIEYSSLCDIVSGVPVSCEIELTVNIGKSE